MEAVSRAFALIKDREIVTGGIVDIGDRFISPTIIKDVSPDDQVMQEEVFGPVLTVLELDSIDEIYSIIECNPKPLAVYIFTTSRKLAQEFLDKTQSGTGRYHGKKSFETFSNTRSVIKKSNLIDFTLRYPPYNSLKLKIIKLMMR